jgi:hypothetical protein
VAVTMTDFCRPVCQRNRSPGQPNRRHTEVTSLGKPGVAAGWGLEYVHMFACCLLPFSAVFVL